MNAEKKTQRYQERDEEKVREYLEEIAEIPKEEIVYIDETGIDTFLHREYGYALKGETVIGSIRGRKYQRLGIVSGLLNGLPVAPLVYDGTMDSLMFEEWFNQCLLPSLPEETVIVMDNAAFHRKKPLARLAEFRGHRLIFLPPYSPELNPIENFWSRLKRKLRKTLSSFASLFDAIRGAFQVN